MSETLLNKNLTGEVHSVFNKTLNIMTENKEIYTLATEDVFDGPQIIKVNCPSFYANQELIDKKVVQEEQLLIIENTLTIDLTEVKIMKSSKINNHQVHSSVLNQLIEEVDLFLSKELDTVGFYRQTFSNEVEKTIHQFLITGSKLLEKGFIQEDSTLMDEAIHKLLGLGHGLTPSGDDFLTGFSLIINSSKQVEVSKKELFNQLLFKGLSQTNLISQKQLILSIQGEALHPVINLINDLYENQPIDNIKGELEKVLSIGSSSGSDIVYGLLVGMKILLNETQKNFTGGKVNE